jgi:hypothetical protein
VEPIRVYFCPLITFKTDFSNLFQIVAGVVSDDDVTSGARRVSTSSLGSSNGGIFAKNRSLWERRTSHQAPI